MHLKKLFFGAVFCLHGSALAQPPSPALLSHIRHLVRAAIDQQLATPLPASTDWDIAVKSPRGAALQDCPQGWRWGTVHVQEWQRIHIPVHCGSARGSWVAQVHASTSVWAPRKDLPAGHRLQRHDLQLQRLRVGQAQLLHTAEDLQDMLLRKPLPAGQAIAPQHLKPPVYATKGQALEIRAEYADIVVVAPGIAPRTAYKGERLKVRNTQSQQWVYGTLRAPGVLQAAELPSGYTGGVRVQLDADD